MWTVSVYAFRRGGWEERLTAVGFLANSYLTLMVIVPDGNQYHRVEALVLSIDIIFLVQLILTALRSRRFWPMWLAAMQGMTILAHLLPLMPHALPIIYRDATALWSYPMWFVLALAVGNRPAQQARYGDSE
ncbi:hypothetical protein [Rhizorhabdus dicambivorans]|nr:hypothetical protein [Rhizorhabdus dicambivorans]